MHGVQWWNLRRWILRFILAVVARPKTALALAALVLIASVGLAAARLRISTDQNKLFSAKAGFFHDYLTFIHQFPENEAIYVLVEPAKPVELPAVARWSQAADALTARLRELHDHVRAVDSRVPIDQLGAQGLLFDDLARVRQEFANMQRFIPLVKLWAEKPDALTQLLGRTPIERFLGGLATQKPDAENAGFVNLLAENWNRTLAEGKTHLPDLASLQASDPSRLGYYYVPEGKNKDKRVLLVRVYPQRNFTSLTAISETVESIRAAVDEVEKQFPEFSFGVTGRPALEADEMRTSNRDTHRAEVVALICVFVGLVVMLRSFWLALAGEIALGVGIGWTFGWATITVGALNLLSIVFLLALIGIGMDYLVQVLIRYREEVELRSHPRTIWIGVFRHVAAPINTACLGAAGAFLVSTLTDFQGAADLGIIAGGGLVLCLLAGYVVLPALLTIFPVKPKNGSHDVSWSEGRPGHRHLPARGGLIRPAIWMIALLLLLPWVFKTKFDPNLLNMQVQELESVQLVKRLPTWSAVVLTKDLDTLRAARSAMQGSSHVANTESILTAYDNLAWLKEHENELPTIEWSTPPGVEARDLSGLAGRASSLAKRFEPAAASASLRGFAKKLEESSGSAAEKSAALLTSWQTGFVELLRQTLAPFHPGPLQIDKLPKELRSHLASDDGTFALYLYPHPNDDLWERERLAGFMHDIENRLAGAELTGAYTLTGIASDILYTTLSIERAFRHATIYALVLIFILVLIDLRKLGQTLVAISVLALGLPMLVALMAITGQNWNFANFFGLPILIGAGHEYGVFMVHRYREAVRDSRRVWRRWDVADRGLLLCAFVTCSSFGFFWALGHHRGLKSLGLVMAMGTACIYLATLMVVRPLLLWKLNRRRQLDSSPPISEDP